MYRSLTAILKQTMVYKHYVHNEKPLKRTLGSYENLIECKINVTLKVAPKDRSVRTQVSVGLWIHLAILVHLIAHSFDPMKLTYRENNKDGNQNE